MGFDSECAKFSLLTKICRPKFYAGEMITPVYELETLKPLQNKKGQKNLRYLTKKQTFTKEKDCFFVGYLKFVWPFLF